MKFALQLLAAAALGLLALVLCPHARADSCARIHRAVVVETPVVVATPVYPAVTAVAVQVPVYSAGYSPPGSAALPPELTLLLQQLSAASIDHGQRLADHEGRIAAVEGVQSLHPLPPMPGALPDSPPLAPKAAGAGVFQSCIRCHDGAAAKAQGHVLFAAGQPTAWDCSTLLEIQDRVTRAPGEKGVMPPDGDLAPEQVQGIIDRLKQLAAQAKK